MKKIREFLIHHSYAIWLSVGCAFLLDSETLTVGRWEWWIVAIPVILLVELKVFYGKTPDRQ